MTIAILKDELVDELLKLFSKSRDWMELFGTWMKVQPLSRITTITSKDNINVNEGTLGILQDYQFI